MNIIFTGKKEIKNELINKLSQLRTDDSRKVNLDQLDTIISRIDLNTVVLCFEAIAKDNLISTEMNLCALVLSHPIHHNSKFFVALIKLR